MDAFYRESAMLSLLAGKRILIAGYGREGKSSYAMLQRLLPGQEQDIAVDNDAIAGKLASAEYDLVLKSPGIPTAFFDGRCDPAILTSQSDIFLQVYGDQTVAVSGTKGKSTTTALIYHALCCNGVKCIMAGNMGIPLFDIVDRLDSQTLVVAELSCHQLENIHRAPRWSVLLNLFQEHLDHYRDYLDYQMAKLQMALRQQSDDRFYYCCDNQALAMIVDRYRCDIRSSVIPYGIDQARTSALAHTSLPLAGDHNLSNMYVALLLLSDLGVSETDAVKAFASFSALEHRLEYVGTYRGILFYNDSISTIPEATMAAVGALKRVGTLILGGFDRGIDYGTLAAFVRDTHIPNLVFVGDAGARIRSLCEQSGPLCANILQTNHYDTIVEWCYHHTEPGNVCLLSPAAASYDAFTNFEHRGRCFKELVVKFGTAE